MFETDPLNFTEFQLPREADARLVELIRLVRSEVETLSWTNRDEYARMRKVKDQLEGGVEALSTRYHPEIPGLNAKQQEMVKRFRTHVNLVEPALDRLTNSIHAGRITRKVSNPEVQRLINKECHQKAMALLCENAFAYGTGYLIPIVRKRTGRKPAVKYWHPDPLWTLLVTDPMDITEVVGVIELVRNGSDTATIGFRFVTKEIEGTFYYATKELKLAEHGCPFAPVVVTYGRDRRHRRCKYGKSLVAPAADGSIRVTNNELNLELLRDRSTQALLLLYGEPTNSKGETKETLQKFLMWNKPGEGDAKFITPESRIEDVLKLTERWCTDTAVSTGLPLDTYRPELVAGSDASATAARQRAFPLNQRMVRMNMEWREAEKDAIAVIGALLDPELAKIGEVDDIAEELAAEVNLLPSIPEAEAETLSNWQQRTEKFFSEPEEAVEYYSGHLSPEKKQELIDRWRSKFDPLNTKGEIFQYHVEGGVVTINEIRKRLGLPEVPWGNQTLPELQAQAEADATDNPTQENNDGEAGSGGSAQRPGVGADADQPGPRGIGGPVGNDGPVRGAPPGRNGDPGERVAGGGGRGAVANGRGKAE